jgi:Flp pilus assembly protein CpaB
MAAFFARRIHNTIGDPPPELLTNGEIPPSPNGEAATPAGAAMAERFARQFLGIDIAAVARQAGELSIALRSQFDRLEAGVNQCREQQAAILGELRELRVLIDKVKK